jgi:hypothetical protein
MPREVIDAHERQTTRVCERLAGGDPDEQRAHQAGPLRHGDRLDRLHAARLRHGLRDHVPDVLEVRARRELGHDAAVRRVRGDLGGDDVREDDAVLVHHGGRRLVAARFDPEDTHEARTMAARGGGRQRLRPSRYQAPLDRVRRLERDRG